MMGRELVYSLPTDFGTTDDGDEECVGDWMLGWNRQMMVEQRIACPEIGYPISEAKYQSIKDWETATGKIWYEEFQP